MLDAIEEGCSTGVLDENVVTTKIIDAFLGGHGRSFYGLDAEKRELIELHKADEQIVDVLRIGNNEAEVVPFRKGRKTWSLSWG